MGDVGLSQEWAGLMNAVEVGEDVNVSHNPTVRSGVNTGKTSTESSLESMFTIAGGSKVECRLFVCIPSDQQNMATLKTVITSTVFV